MRFFLFDCCKNKRRIITKSLKIFAHQLSCNTNKKWNIFSLLSALFSVIHSIICVLGFLYETTQETHCIKFNDMEKSLFSFLLHICNCSRQVNKIVIWFWFKHVNLKRIRLFSFFSKIVWGCSELASKLTKNHELIDSINVIMNHRKYLYRSGLKSKIIEKNSDWWKPFRVLRFHIMEIWSDKITTINKQFMKITIRFYVEFYNQQNTFHSVIRFIKFVSDAFCSWILFCLWMLFNLNVFCLKKTFSCLLFYFACLLFCLWTFLICNLYIFIFLLFSHYSYGALGYDEINTFLGFLEPLSGVINSL